MSYVFISHAAEDKLERVKPLVEALIMEGITVWLDRPGHGDSHFNFDEDYIHRHGIRSLATGQAWDDQIEAVLRGASAVLVCMSRAFRPDRTVLTQEMLIGRYERKLVACIVDDIGYDEIPRDIGLLRPAAIQSVRIDPAKLRLAVQKIDAGECVSPDDLPDSLRAKWESVRKLVADIRELETAAAGAPSPKTPRIGDKRIPVSGDTCLAFVDRKLEAQRCEEELATLTGVSVLPVVVAGNDKDWPQALALRLQAETPGNRLHVREHINVQWPSPDKKTRDERLRILAFRIETELKTQTLRVGGSAPATSAYDLGPDLSSMIQRGGGRLIVSYAIPASDWLAVDKEVLREHMAWWSKRIAGRAQTQLILLLAIIETKAEARTGWWPFGGKPIPLTPTVLAEQVAGAISLMGKRERLKPIAKDDLSDWKDKLDKRFHLPLDALIALESAGERVLLEETPHGDFRSKVLRECANIFV